MKAFINNEIANEALAGGFKGCNRVRCIAAIVAKSNGLQITPQMLNAFNGASKQINASRLDCCVVKAKEIAAQQIKDGIFEVL